MGMSTPDPPSLLGSRRSPHPQEAGTSQAPKPPSKPGGLVRSRFLPHLQVALSWGSSRCQGQGWCVGNPVKSPVPSRGWWCPWKPPESSYLARKMSKAYMAADMGAGGRERGGESEKTPLQAAFIQNAFPDVSLWPVGAPSAHCSVYR